MDIKEISAGCRTYRRFTQEPVPEEVVCAMLENVRLASCSKNGQALRFTVARSSHVVERMQPLLKWAAALPPEEGTPKPGEQPTLLVAISKTPDVTPYSDIDTGIAARVLCETAWEAGVGSAIIASVSRIEASAVLGIPEDEELRLVIAFGYPAHKSTVVDVPADGTLDYYLDDNRDYCVPKLPVEQISRVI